METVNIVAKMHKDISYLELILFTTVSKINPDYIYKMIFHDKFGLKTVNFENIK